MTRAGVCEPGCFSEASSLRSGAFFTARGAFAEALTLTAKQTEGPFYPDHLPLDTDKICSS